MEKEKKMITLSMVILFFSLIVVYSLFYQIKGHTLLTTLGSQQKNEKSLTLNESWTKEKELHLELSTWTTEPTWIFEWELFSDISTWNTTVQVEKTWEQTASPASELTFDGKSPVMLSGTDVYFGAVESIELLGLEPEYLLKDKKGFYYAKFEKEPDLKKTVESLGGNIYVLNSESELIKNNLFGDKISFINLPEYKDKLVIMILVLDEQYWLIQMEYNKYHQAKNYLKTLFTK